MGEVRSRFGIGGGDSCRIRKIVTCPNRTVCNDSDAVMLSAHCGKHRGTDPLLSSRIIIIRPYVADPPLPHLVDAIVVQLR